MHRQLEISPPARRNNLVKQGLSPEGNMALEHAGQSPWEQGAVGILCGAGGSLLAYWSLQGALGFAVILLCVAFSTLVTAALCHYYDRVVRPEDHGRPVLNSGASVQAST